MLATYDVSVTRNAYVSREHAFAPAWRRFLAGLCDLALTVLVAAVPMSGVRAQNVVCDNGLIAGDDALGSATGASATACGFGADASGANSSAYGNDSTASGTFSSAYGLDSEASSTNSSAFGRASTASGVGSSAFGINSTASGASSSAYGNNSTASGQRSSALGNQSTASGASSVAIGDFAQANHANSAAFGSGATTTRANQQVFGTADNTYTMSGITSAASKAAQTGPIELVTTDANGNLASASIDSLVMDSRVGKRIEENTEGVAMALAMAGSFDLPDGKTFAIGGSVGTFEGGNAMGFGATGRLGDNTYLSGGIGFGLSEGTVGGRAGVLFAW